MRASEHMVRALQYSNLSSKEEEWVSVCMKLRDSGRSSGMAVIASTFPGDVQPPHLTWTRLKGTSTDGYSGPQ